MQVKSKAGSGAQDRRGSKDSAGSFTSVGLKDKMKKSSDTRDASLKKDSTTKAGDRKYDPLSGKKDSYEDN